MSAEIEKATERVTKLRAQIDKVSGPLAAAEAQLRAAEDTEKARRAEREIEYSRQFAGTWMGRAEEAANSGDDARQRFFDALSAEPWFAAYVEYRAARHKRGHVMTEAQRAQRTIGEVVTVPEQRYYAAQILASLPGAHYVNHPWSNRAAEFKPAQLSTAQGCGFLVPSTVITDDPDEARTFAAQQSGGVVYKPVWNTPYRVDDQPNSVWVREVRAAEITDAVSVCPHMFQAKVDKAFDVRVTAVGARLFGVRIDSPDLDWRYRQDLMTCTPIEVPASVARAVAAYLAELRLHYGAFDFAVTPAGDWYFLECNPNGQWAWQPAQTTAAIAQALTDQLEKGPDT
ncbi:hypothetical protein [Kitasatospora aureofaciens]|uniref:hypothetical protein n=1 Tax=Kitasatospora aureofaciens TaxID=1894 RepID=UPI0033EF3EE2